MRKLLSFRRFRVGASLASLIVLGAVSVAVADNVQVNDVATGGDVTSALPGDRSAKVRIVGNAAMGDITGCNVDAANKATVTLSSDKSWVTFPSGPSAVIEACGNIGEKTVTYRVAASAPAGATAKISTSTSGGKAGSVYSEDSFTVSTPAAPADSTGPDISFTLDPASPTGANGWHRGPVTVDWTVSDSESSITSSTGCDDTTVSADGEYDLTCEATSSGGTSSKTASFKIDQTAPAVQCGSADGVWHNVDVSISCTASDGDTGSGLNPTSDANFSLSTSVAANTETNDASTATKTVSDLAGNTTVAGPITGNKVDKKAPSVQCDSADGQWHAADVSIGCEASDDGSGLNPTSDANFSLSTNVAANTETNDASTGTKTVSDAVGNFVTAGPITGNKVDKKGPAISCDTPAPTFTVGQSPATVTGTASDGGSGPASATVSDLADTSSVGSKSVSLTAQDAVGNSGSQSCSYSVLFGFSGLFAPIDRPTWMNVSKAGQAIPLKWRLIDANGGAVTTLTSVKVQVSDLGCNSYSTLDQLEEYAANASGLQNLGDGYYQFNWKSPTTYANSCKSLKLDLGEGTPRTVAYVQFKK